MRATRDVDAVVGASRAEFPRIESQVAKAGFRRDTDGEVICRWVHRESGVLLDLMPVQPDVLGLSNIWYAYAVASATSVDIGAESAIRVANAVAFVATKLEAFRSRGNADVMASHDLEGILNVVDGREELGAELAQAPQEVRAAVTTTFAALLDHPDFMNVFPGLIADRERAGIVAAQLRAMSR